MSRVGVALALMSLLSPFAHSGTWFDDQPFEHDGQTRYYRYYVPDQQPPGGYPVVFLIHGGGGSMRDVLNNGTDVLWPTIADENDFLLIVPNGVNRTTGDTFGDDQAWNDCRTGFTIADTTADDVGFIDALIDWASAEFTIDSQRIYSTGGSNGGMMSYRLAFELGDRIAAIASFIANLPEPSECAPPTRAIPVFVSNGDAETNYMPWVGGCVVANQGCGRGTVLSALETREFWIAHNGVAEAASDSFVFPDIEPNDGATARYDFYTSGYEGTEVMFYRIEEGGHVKPTIAFPRPELTLLLLGLGNQCQDLEGSREAWDFLSRHTLDGNGAGTAPGEVGLLQAKKEAGGIALSWAGDCGAAAQYGVYRGDLTLGFASLVPEPGGCDVSSRSTTVPFGPGGAEFFVVVPNDGAEEGGYGEDSSGVSRSPGGSSCYAQAAVDACAAN